MQNKSTVFYLCKIKNLDFDNNTIYILGKGSKERIVCIANNNITKLLKNIYSY
jgi:site-specific recombinase XerD